MTHRPDASDFASVTADWDFRCDAAVQTEEFCSRGWGATLCNVATQTLSSDCLSGLNASSSESCFGNNGIIRLPVGLSKETGTAAVINRTDVNSDLDQSQALASCDVEEVDFSPGTEDLPPRIDAVVNNIIASHECSEMRDNNCQIGDRTFSQEDKDDGAIIAPLLCPSGLECLLDTSQIVIHTGNLRHDIFLNVKNVRRMEAISEMRRVLFYIEQDPPPPLFENSFLFRIYNRDKEEVMQVLNPASHTCIACGLNWHWFKSCRFEAVVYSPPGTVAGFIKRRRTCLVQEFQILGPSEEILLRLRGSPNDLKVYSIDLLHELGRLSIHGWVGVMHEIRRTANDYGLTFPIDLDVHVKGLLLSAVIVIDWLYSTQGGKR